MTEASQPGKSRGRLWLAFPLVVFAIIAVVFKLALTSGDPSKLPSALIGKPVPVFDLPGIEGMSVPGIASRDLAQGGVTVLNVFASWCAPCHDEHPFLMDLAKRGGFRLAGLNYKDDPADARRFLGKLGNPYAVIGSDARGRTALDLGVYGVPETFVIGKDGKIAFKHVGPLSDYAVRTELMPEIDKALASN